MEDHPLIGHLASAIPARVSVAMSVIDNLRPFPDSVMSPEAAVRPEEELACFRAACKVLTHYLLGEHEFKSAATLLLMRQGPGFIAIDPSGPSRPRGQNDPEPARVTP